MSDIHYAGLGLSSPAWLRGAATAWRRLAGWGDCALLLVLAGGLRALGTASLPLWLDELITVYWSQLPLGYLLGAGARNETNPPLYYVMMHGWIDVFGDSPLSMHVPPLIFASLTVPVVYLAAKTLFDRGTALLAGLLVSVDPFWVMYGQEARCYALLGLFYALAFLALAVVFTRRGGGAPPRRWLALFVLAVSAGLYLHFTALLFLAACFVVAGVDLVADWPRSRAAILPWVWAGVATALCIAVPVFLAVSQAGAVSIKWIPPLSGLVVWNFLASALLSPLCWTGWTALVCGALLLVAPAAGAWRLRLSRPQWLLLLVLPALFCLLLFLASLKLPMVIPRVGIFLAMPAAILLARCVMSQDKWAPRWLVGVAALAAWVVPLCKYYHAPQKEDWRTAAAIAVAAPACNGPLMYVEDTGLGLVYYQPSLMARPLYSLSVGVNQRGLTREDIFYARRDILEQTYLHSNFLYLRDAAGFVAQHPHTMLVLRPVDQAVLRFMPRPKAFGLVRGPLLVTCY
jgi:uncharacterized membrane protein